MTEYIDKNIALSFPFANGEYDYNHANEHFIYGCETYKEWLETLLTADVRENIKARWIDMGNYLLCSNCGATHYGADKNYCPNCGARMDKVKNEN